MKKMSLWAVAGLLVCAGILVTASCTGGGDNKMPSPLQMIPGGGGGGGGGGGDFSKMMEALTAASGGGGQNLAALDDVTLQDAMAALNGLGELKAGSFRSAQLACPTESLSDVCPGGGSAEIAPDGADACKISFNSCDVGGGIVVDGAVIFSVLNDSVWKIEYVNYSVAIPGVGTTTFSMAAYLYIVSQDPWSYIVVVESTVVNGQYVITGSDSCSVTVTWDSANSCFTVDSTACAGSFTDTCP